MKLKMAALAMMAGTILNSSSNSNYFVYVGTYSEGCLLYTSPSPRDRQKSRMPSSA